MFSVVPGLVLGQVSCLVGVVNFISVSGGSNSTSTASSPLNEVSSLGGALPTVSYVLTPTVQLQDHS